MIARGAEGRDDPSVMPRPKGLFGYSEFPGCCADIDDLSFHIEVLASFSKLVNKKGLPRQPKGGRRGRSPWESQVEERAPTNGIPERMLARLVVDSMVGQEKESFCVTCSMPLNSPKSGV